MNISIPFTIVNPYQYTKLSLVLACAFGVSLQPVFAQDLVTPATDDNNAGSPPTMLEPVKIIANPENPQSSMGSAYVLSAEELNKFKHTNINQVLRGVPGVYVREEDGLGMFPRIGVRASSAGRSDRISVLEDGIPAAMSPYSNPSAYYFPNVGRISSIEILKGPEVLMHGPHTTSGAVNVISTPIPDKLTGAVNVEVGAFRTSKIHAHYGGTFDAAAFGQFGFLLETYQGKSNGFHDIDRSKHTAGYDINEYIGKARWKSAPGARFAQQLDVKLHYDDERLDVSYLGLTDADFREDQNRRYGLSELERMNRGRRSASIRHQFGFNENHSLDTAVYWTETYRYYNRLNQINGINLGGVTDIINNNGANADLLRGILHGTRNTTHANGVRYGNNDQRFTVKGVQIQSHNRFKTGPLEHQLLSGVRYSEETPENAVKGLSNAFYQQVNGSLVHQRTDSAVPTEGKLNALSFWIGDKISLGNLMLFPVLRHERIDSKANIADNATQAQIDSRMSNSLNNTRVGLGVNYAINQQWTVLTGVHQGFAPPGNGVGKGTKGETSTNYEAGVRFRNNRFSADAIGFYTDFKNTLRQCLFANPCSSPVPGGAPIVDGSTQQTGSKEVYGVEFSGTGDLYRGNSIIIPVRFSYTYTDGKYTGGSDLPTGVRAGDVIEYTPKHVASFQLGVEGSTGHGDWNTFAVLSYIDGSYTTSSARRPGVDNTYLKTQGLFVVDLVASYPLSRWADMYFRADNIFNEQKITHRGADGARGNAPRWLSAGLKLKF